MALFFEDGTPVVGMILRFDRVDYFWFTLLHELGHVIKHLSQEDMSCILDYETGKETADVIEKEANEMAANSFIPHDVWLGSDARRTASKKSIYSLAMQLDIHEAIVAGRVRKERNNYRIHSQMLGGKKVKELFEAEE